MKDFPIFFNFTQELHLIELCLIISQVCSKVPIHLEKVNTILWRVKTCADLQLETTKPLLSVRKIVLIRIVAKFSSAAENCVNPHRCEIQQRCVVQRPEP